MATPEPPGGDELRRRRKAYDRERAIVAAFGYLPFLLIYVLVHTRYLAHHLPASKTAAVGVLIGLPAAWFAAVMLLYGWLGPRRHGLSCPRCGARLIGARFDHAVDGGRCSACDTPLVPSPARDPATGSPP